jgi:hypothetical protein
VNTPTTSIPHQLALARLLHRAPPSISTFRRRSQLSPKTSDVYYPPPPGSLCRAEVDLIANRTDSRKPVVSRQKSPIVTTDLHNFTTDPHDYTMPPKHSRSPEGYSEGQTFVNGDEFTRVVRKRLSTSTRTGQACDRCKVRDIPPSLGSPQC